MSRARNGAGAARRGVRLVAALVFPLTLALGACGDGGGGQTSGGHDAGPSADAGTGTATDALPDVKFVGPAATGKIPKGPELDATPGTTTPVSADALPACCPTLLTLADPTGDEPWARIKGDIAPLKGEGVPATWSNGAWTATVCLQASMVTRYHFELAAVDGADGGTADAGATAAYDGGTTPENHDTWRVNGDVLTAFDDDANIVNVVVTGETCGGDATDSGTN